MIDVVTPGGEFTGKTLPRDKIHENGAWHRTVHIWVCDQKGSVLLQKRSAEKDSHPSMWDVSCAGHIESGDTSINAAIRELDEELGIAAEPGELYLLCTLPSTFVLQNGRFIDNEWVDVYLLRKDIASISLKLQKEEVEAVDLIPIDELENRILRKDPQLVPHPAIHAALLEYIADSVNKSLP